VGLPIALALSFCVGTYGGSKVLLFDAIRSGQVRKIQAALEQGIDANATTASGQTPLILAASLGRVRIVRLLLDHHAFINTKDENGATALMAASTLGHLASFGSC
jgi:ankyrin repeat protein